METGWNTFIRILCLILFESSDRKLIIGSCLYMAGVWRLLHKSGLKEWWALVPCARDYQLARCAGREPEGRVLSTAEFLRIVLSVLSLVLKNDVLIFMSFVGTFSVLMVIYLYNMKIWSGLIEVYGVRKRWLWLPALGLDFIPALLWGWSPKYQPEWKAEDMRQEMLRMASVGSVAVMDKGLTVNLKERSTLEFFRKKILLWDIHMYIPQGHMVLLLGGSGAGKTTFVNAVTGYEKAKAEVVLNGIDMYKQYRKMQYETGFVPQQELMRYKDTIYNTLMDTAKLRLPKDVPTDARKKRVEEVMEIFGLTPSRTHLVQKLSGGQRKRVSVAMELISNPSLFILDEPDSGLDGVMARELMEQLRRVADTGKIVIVITHTPDRVIDFFDDVIVLAKDSSRAGRLAFFGSIPDAKEFFGCETMEQIVSRINVKDVGGEGRADEFVAKYAEVQYA